jgi:hypothetical protein
LKLEEQTRARLLEKVEQNINAQNGTYIDWQYLEKAADSLAKVSLVSRKDQLGDYVENVTLFFDRWVFLHV